MPVKNLGRNSQRLVQSGFITCLMVCKKGNVESMMPSGKAFHLIKCNPVLQEISDLRKKKEQTMRADRVLCFLITYFPIRLDVCGQWGRVAKRFMTVPATSVPLERVFCMVGNIVNKKRSCLLPEHVNMLVFMKQRRAFS